MPGIRVDRLLASTAVALLLDRRRRRRLGRPVEHGERQARQRRAGQCGSGMRATPAATEAKPQSTQGAARRNAGAKTDASGNATTEPRSG